MPIYEVGAFEGNHFFTMKFIDGRSMAHEMPRLVKAPRDGVRLLVKVCRAIHYAHQHGILHRDLKPANILLDGQGEPHVTDFGLAKRTEGDSQLTQTGTIVGTPSYMSPEQAAPSQTPLTTAADVYSLGAILYEILTGRPPFRGDSPLDTLMLVLNKEAERPRSINAGADRDLETIALKCLEKDPARRYGSAEALAEDLDRWLNQRADSRAADRHGRARREMGEAAAGDRGAGAPRSLVSHDPGRGRRDLAVARSGVPARRQRQRR